HARNYSTNIYLEGALISMALDIDLLDKSNGQQSYRDVHRSLYKNHKMPHGFTAANVKTILKDLTGRDYSDWWAMNVDSPAAID
ncbi:hypothetical protein, partial [Streptomyces scabiei]|uniref:hypothetical protein n=1 Tax=Streptomyces scabiei TaxID=1930 RepID=UPI0038F6CEBD